MSARTIIHDYPRYNTIIHLYPLLLNVDLSRIWGWVLPCEFTRCNRDDDDDGFRVSLSSSHFQHQNRGTTMEPVRQHQHRSAPFPGADDAVADFNQEDVLGWPVGSFADDDDSNLPPHGMMADGSSGGSSSQSSADSVAHLPYPGLPASQGTTYSNTSIASGVTAASRNSAGERRAEPQVERHDSSRYYTFGHFATPYSLGMEYATATQDNRNWASTQMSRGQLAFAGPAGLPKYQPSHDQRLTEITEKPAASRTKREGGNNYPFRSPPSSTKYNRSPPESSRESPSFAPYDGFGLDWPGAAGGILDDEEDVALDSMESTFEESFDRDAPAIENKTPFSGSGQQLQQIQQEEARQLQRESPSPPPAPPSSPPPQEKVKGPGDGANLSPLPIDAPRSVPHASASRLLSPRVYNKNKQMHHTNSAPQTRSARGRPHPTHRLLSSPIDPRRQLYQEPTPRKTTMRLEIGGRSATTQRFLDGINSKISKPPRARKSTQTLSLDKTSSVQPQPPTATSATQAEQARAPPPQPPPQPYRQPFYPYAMTMYHHQYHRYRQPLPPQQPEQQRQPVRGVPPTSTTAPAPAPLMVHGFERPLIDYSPKRRARDSPPKPAAVAPAPPQRAVEKPATGYSHMGSTDKKVNPTPKSPVPLEPKEAAPVKVEGKVKGKGKTRRPNIKRTQQPCNCKKSKCLKLYCECFSSEVFCEGCNCNDCNNTPNHVKIRDDTIKEIKLKNPKAFQPRIAPSSTHNVGCRCKRSECLKKYCEVSTRNEAKRTGSVRVRFVTNTSTVFFYLMQCFGGGIMCGSNCKCVDCKNVSGSQSLIDKRRRMKDTVGAEFAMREAERSWKAQLQRHQQPTQQVVPPCRSPVQPPNHAGVLLPSGHPALHGRPPVAHGGHHYPVAPHPHHPRYAPYMVPPGHPGYSPQMGPPPMTPNYGSSPSQNDRARPSFHSQPRPRAGPFETKAATAEATPSQALTRITPSATKAPQTATTSTTAVKTPEPHPTPQMIPPKQSEDKRSFQKPAFDETAVDSRTLDRSAGGTAAAPEAPTKAKAIPTSPVKASATPERSKRSAEELADESADAQGETVARKRKKPHDDELYPYFGESLLSLPKNAALAILRCLPKDELERSTSRVCRKWKETSREVMTSTAQ